MITSAKYVNYIIEAINVLRQEIISKTSIGFTDDNIHLENFVRDLLNKVYKYDLKNLNEEKANYPGIDLGNKTDGIGFQITSTKTSDKINETITKVIDDKHQVFKTYTKLKFFILTNKQTTYTIIDTHNKIQFVWKEDILDFDDIYLKSMYLPLQEQKDLVDYIHQQIPYVSEQSGIDYYNPNTIKRLIIELKKENWTKTEDGAEFKIEHNLGYIPNVSILDKDGNETISPIKKNEKFIIIKVGSDSFEGNAIIS